MQVFWHRRDLRAHDNLGLAAAADEDDVLPVFVFDDDVLAHASPVRVAFLLDALRDLRSWYRDRGSDLVVRRGDPSGVIPDLAHEHDADRVVWNHDYTGLAQERDDVVREALDARNTAHEQFHDAVHHEPGAIRTNAGDPYSVYTYFWKKWRDREKAAPADPPAADALADVSGGELPSLAELGFGEPEADYPAAGHAAAVSRLDDFCERDIFDYDDGREYPAREGTSRVSQDLTYGTLGVREAYARTAKAMQAADGADDETGVEEFRRQLAFREFYQQVLYFHPRVVTENYNDYENPIEWRNDEDEIAAWKAGETGVPIVDAGMRQLREDAYVHNRVRMIVASFLTKDLLVDWRVGYDHFREYLVDHDTANDNGGWQWAASTGTDAQPYFRIFNPWTQQADYDPDAEYIREYVPELADADTEDIHGWNDLSENERESVAPDYPAPIVEHSERRERALELFEAARGED
ncbi:deoxyribodipyrimidine photo-lyase [Salarchaeum sp. JOR-1]|uniref:cryptochrome/photolyase family protein n=1 Tax=Salarchaeum sp. JOR-1 TaxID=2599399 RepID=UPI0011983826|nr:deoxyribodipyrimidine photo-lyase [Salarchaeum sp. JOR-1]QDX41139.1 deoxyribodipyrimidine photo-lyase [Salarchaeum sp. JOR-1]